MEPTGVSTAPDTLAGFHLIRRIGSGSRSVVFLARPASNARDTTPVALKVFRRQAEPTLIAREVHALVTTPPGTLTRLEDVATTADGRVCLVLEYLPGLALDRLLAVRGRVGAAEVVTIVATITATLQALHDSGVSHPSVRSSCVRFGASGRPLLLGLGALGELPAGVAGVGVRRDALVALTAFVHGLLAYLDPADPAGPGVPALVAEFESATVARPFPARLVSLESALFGWADAGPVTGAAGIGTAEIGETVSMPAGVPSHVAVAAAGGVGLATPDVAPGGRGSRTWRSAVSRLARAGAVVWERAAASTLGAGRRVRGRPLLLAAAAGVLLSIGGVAALSGVPPASSTGSPGTTTGATGDGSGTLAPAHERDVSGRGPGGTGTSAVDGDDPVAAGLELLRRREGCLTAASVVCLDAVDQAGSVAMAADAFVIRQSQATPNTDSPESGTGSGPAVTAVLQERTGNAALLVLGYGAEEGTGQNTQPASALVIKGEAGWRLRELFDY